MLYNSYCKMFHTEFLSIVMFTIGRILFVGTHAVILFSHYTTWTIPLFRYFPIDYSLLGSLFRIIQVLLFLLSTISYYRASFTNAGPIKIGVPPEPKLCDQLSKVCSKCENRWKPPRAHHCKTCKVCVFRMDHHCEWINNCVGSHNQKYFILFLLYIFISSILTFIINLLGIIYWAQQQKRGLALAILNVTFCKVMVGTTMIFTVFFAIFTGEFLYNQLEVISDNQTTVESYKECYGRPNDFFTNLRQVFGDKYWLIPIRPKLQMNYLELMYDPEYVTSANLYLEDSFYNKSGQFYEFFDTYRIN